MGSHRENPLALAQSLGLCVSLPRPRVLPGGSAGRREPTRNFSDEEFLDRWETTLRRVERHGLRGQGAEAVAIALLFLKDHPDYLREVSVADVRSGVKTARRAAARRREEEREAFRRRLQVDTTPGPPTRGEQQESRRLLAALLDEGAQRVPPRDLQAFARRLLGMWGSDPASVLDGRHRRDDAVRSVFADLLRRGGVEVTELERDRRFERILLGALRMWAHPSSSPRSRRRRRS